MDNTNC